MNQAPEPLDVAQVFPCFSLDMQPQSSNPIGQSPYAPRALPRKHLRIQQDMGKDSGDPRWNKWRCWRLPNTTVTAWPHPDACFGNWYSKGPLLCRRVVTPFPWARSVGLSSVSTLSHTSSTASVSTQSFNPSSHCGVICQRSRSFCLLKSPVTLQIRGLSVASFGKLLGKQ